MWRVCLATLLGRIRKEILPRISRRPERELTGLLNNENCTSFENRLEHPSIADVGRGDLEEISI